MSWILEDLSYESTCSAVEANLFEALASFDRWPRCEVHRDEDMLWYVSDIPHPLYNGVLDARSGAEEVEKRVEETVARFQARGVPMMWWIGPSTRPDRLGEVLLAHGMSYRRNPAGMAIDLSRADEGLAVPPGLSIRSVDTLHDSVRPDFVNGFL
jgi:hypothetical protein